MILVPINIPTFCICFSKIFLQLLLPIKFLIITFDFYFEVNFCIFFNEIMQKYVEYCKKKFPKKLEFF